MTETEKQNQLKKRAEFAQAFYKEVQSVIGGDNSQEKLVLMLPGIALKQSDYAFDKVKSPIVEANESRLANKLYDPAELVGADNGMTLPTQYMSALNALTPKINTFIARAKNKLRELLIKKYPFTFEYSDGTSKYNPDSTFQEVYFHLYNDYLEAARAWAQKQTLQKQELGNNTNEYLTWYQDNAEVEFNIINQKRARILALFSPNDMKILEGVLDSGSGAELQEARQMLNNLKKMNPDGSYTYPVSFYPSDWHKYLNTSFTPVDLLNSPEKIADDIRLLVARRTGITYQLDTIREQIPDATDLANATTAAREAEQAWDEAFNAMAMAGEKAGVDFIINTVKSVCSVCSSSDQAKDVLKNITTQQTGENNETQEKSISDSMTENVAELMGKAKSNEDNSKEKKFLDGLKNDANPEDKVDLTNVDRDSLADIAAGKKPVGDAAFDTASAAVSKVVSDVFDEIKKGAKVVDDKQKDLMTKISDYLKTETYATKLANRAQLKTTLSMLENQLADINAKLEELKSNFSISLQTKGGSVEPPTIPEGFSQCLITHQMNSTSAGENSFTTATKETSKKGFWIFKKSTTTSSSTSDFDSFCENDDTTISIGMNIAKVTIEREWFNPGLFLLTKSMYSLSEVKISDGEDSLAIPGAAAKNILPCYPTAFVVARDVTIKITNTNSTAHSHAHSFSSETSSSSSFFVFHSGDGTKVESTNNTSSSRFDGNTLTMKFATPQVIGVYLHTIAKDESSSYPTNLENEDLSTITRFVDSYKDILDNHFITK